MANIQSIPGLTELWSRTTGTPEVRIAILDGPVDLKHDCFEGVQLTQVERVAGTEVDEASPSFAREHGTLVASIVMGRHGSSVSGLAPGCRAFQVPIFSDHGRKPSQLDLARAIERALNLGVHVINISGGQLSENGEAEGLLLRAVRTCANSNVLVVAAAGNDGCKCLHVPAAISSVLAVGAVNDKGEPLGFSNWGETYQTQGLLAPGKDIYGAKPGGGTTTASGTSVAAPIVTGVAALLLSLQLKEAGKIDPGAVRTALLKGADPCDPTRVKQCDRFLVGKLNVHNAIQVLFKAQGGTMSEMNELPIESLEPSAIPSHFATQLDASPYDSISPSCACQQAGPEMPSPVKIPTGVIPAVASSPSPGLVYVLGTLGYDFGTEARRDSFKQLMPPTIVDIAGTEIPVPANPYDTRQMVSYLASQPSEARSLIWTLSLDLTPIYAIEPSGPYGADVYKVLVDQLKGESLAPESPDFVERVSIPGVLTGRSVKLFSGQIVPVVELINTRGVYGWHVNALMDAATTAASSASPTRMLGAAATPPDNDTLRTYIRDFLNRLYYDYRNLGTTSSDRALNFAATNILLAVQVFGQAIAAGKSLDGIDVVRSPFCRPDSDCWDVKLKFFDPENNQRARSVFRFTIDVSDIIPVTLGNVTSWSQSI